MRLTRVVAEISALCLVTGSIVYAGMFLWPQLASSTMEDIKAEQAGAESPKLLYKIGDALGPTRPNAVTVDAKGRTYVTDAGTAKVFVFSEAGRKISAFGGPGAGKTNLSFPNGIVVTQEGNLMIADSSNNDIKLFSPSGKYLKTILKPSKKIRPGVLTKGPDGLIYVSDLINNRILVIDEQGKTRRNVADAKNPLSYPQGTAVDAKGRLWVADSGNYAIRIFDPEGRTVKTITGGGNPSTSFSMVRGAAFDKSGQAYIADTISHQVRVFDSTGRQLSVFPSEERGFDGLVFPTGIFVDNNEKLFVVDRGANDIKVFSIKK